MSADEDATIRRLARAGHSDVEIAHHLGWDRQRVRRRRLALGIETGYSPIHRRVMARLQLRRLCAGVAA